MPSDYDLIVRQAQLRGRSGNLMEIGIRSGVIAEIAEKIHGGAGIELDAAGGLVTESFANPHLHLCKVYTLQMMDESALKDYHGADMGKAMTAIELAARVKENYDEKWIIKNVRRAVAQAARFGCTHIRAFADVDSKARLEGVKALIRAREEFKCIVDIQVVAFAQDGIVREAGATELMRQAMQLGADVAGGIPWIEYTDEDIQEHVKVIFDLAEEFDKDVSMLVDDAGDPSLRQTEMMAVEAIRRGWTGRVLAHHARAMSSYPIPYYRKLAALLKQADMGVVTNPHTGPLHTRVRELLEDGVDVTLGQDDISDAYYPYGRNNMLEVAFLASHLLWMTTAREMETLYDMATVLPTRRLRIDHPGIVPGAPADLVVLAAPTVPEALRSHEAPKAVVSQGRLVDAAKMKDLAGE